MRRTIRRSMSLEKHTYSETCVTRDFEYVTREYVTRELAAKYRFFYNKNAQNLAKTLEKKSEFERNYKT